MNWYITQSAYLFTDWCCVSTADEYMEYEYIKEGLI